MKKALSLALVLIFVLSFVPSFAEGDVTLLVKDATAVDGVKIADEVTLNAGQYVKFTGVNLDGVKSVLITGTPNYGTAKDGEVMEIRLDSMNGSLLGYVPMIGTNEEASFGVNVNVSGTHDVFVSPIVANNASIKSITLSKDTCKELSYDRTVSDADVLDLHVENWAMTDGLGRTLADYEEVGELDPTRNVGLFYHTWHASWEDGRPVVNNTEWFKKYPEIFAPDQYMNPQWPTDAIYCWDEPLFGYYSGVDYWVYRKHAEILGSAGVNFLYFDDTNGSRYFHKNMSTLAQAFSDAMKMGTPSPKIAMLSNLSYPVAQTWPQIKHAYLSFYKPGMYKETWYYFEGKPLFMGHIESIEEFYDKNDPADVALANEIMDFFTFRGNYAGAPYTLGKWQSLDAYSPKEPVMTKSSTGRSEAISLNFASLDHHVTGIKVAASSPYVYTQGDTHFYGRDYRENMHLYDIFAEEQYAAAKDVDADILLIDSWNEWQVGRQKDYSNMGKDDVYYKNSFIDLFDERTSRDCEMTKGSSKDYSYSLLCDFVRKWKGLNKPAAASAEVTIDIAGDSAQWNSVAPEFINNRGTYTRNQMGYGGVVYENYTARNNVILSKVARDSEKVYFYAETLDKLTPETDDKWMRLYINTDRNRATGWEGYEIRINGQSAGSFEVYENGAWVLKGSVAYKAGEKTLQIAIPRADALLSGTLDFEFKWVDNADDSDILNFYVDGNAAPLGRFNYRYTEKELISMTKEQRTSLSGTTIVKGGSNRAAVNGAKMFTYEADLRYGARVLEDGVTYFPVNLLKESLTFGKSKIIFEADRNFVKMQNHDILVYTYVGGNYAYANGAYKTITTPVRNIDGIPYIPVTFMAEAFGMEVYAAGDNLYAFGYNVDKATVDAVKNQF